MVMALPNLFDIMPKNFAGMARVLGDLWAIFFFLTVCC